MNKHFFLPRSNLIPFVLATGFIIRLIFLFATPLFYAPDEQAHFKYIQYLSDNNRFPIQTTMTGAETNDWEYYQPPLYYLLTSPIFLLARKVTNNNMYIIVWSLRSISIILWLINCKSTQHILDNLNIYNIYVRVFVYSMIGLLPTYTFLSSVINNDNLLITLGGLLLLVITSRSFSPLLIGSILGITLLTKLTAIVYCFLTLFVLLKYKIINEYTLSQFAYKFLVTFLIATAIWSPWAIRNWLLYQSITAEHIANVPAQWKSIWSAIYVVQKSIKNTFWSTSGIYNNVRFLPDIGVHLSYIAVSGLIWGSLFDKARLRHVLNGNEKIFVAFLLSIVINMVLVFRFGIMYGQPQGRFLFPQLVPIALVLGVGLSIFHITEHRYFQYYFVLALVLYLVGFLIYSLYMFEYILVPTQ